MPIKIVVTGTNQFSAGLYKNVAKANFAARNIVTKGAEVIKENAKKEFRPTQPKSVPAIPTSPTNRTGTLRDSIQMIGLPIPFGKNGWMSQTGPKPEVKYAGYVEYGTSRMTQSPYPVGYPYMKPGFQKSEKEIELIAQEEWRAAQE
jgi:HK97 gp10 family phage protein